MNRFKAQVINGASVPDEPHGLPEGSQVDLIVEGPDGQPPIEKDPQARKRILGNLIERMRRNPISEGAHVWSRDELHDRP